MEETQAAQPLLSQATEVDEELLALPAPERTGKWPTAFALALALGASVWMAVSLLADVRFAAQSGSDENLGDLRSASLSTSAGGPSAAGGRLVKGTALLSAGTGIRFERPFVSDTFRLVAVSGRSDLWVELRVPDGEESSRYVPPSEVSGRLVPMSEAGPRHRGLEAALKRVKGIDVPVNAWLLVDGERPAGLRYATMLLMMFSVFAVVALGSLYRILRPIRD